ncbi:uncharacterized protein LOC121303293 [Polyodon spathula]|uniref:uncharacterized protein LOC121303293 n=1 Tax=Polyodon spathula TaxID=7913 RepID=UPI001B7F4066|nr:uncharacterized protein LOC121303293 [Polyodon spathula]
MVSVPCVSRRSLRSGAVAGRAGVLDRLRFCSPRLALSFVFRASGLSFLPLVNHIGSQIETSRERRYSVESAGGTSYLRFQVKQSDHERKLKCVLSVDSKERAFAEYQVFITAAVLEPNTTETVYVAEGEFVQLPCVGISNRTEGRHVEWSFQATGDQSQTHLNVSAPGHPTVNPRERVSLLPNASLLIQGVQRPDTGTYHCRRGQQEKYHTLTVCVLTVKANTSSPVSKGTEVTVSCSLLCDHTPQDAVLQWMDSNGTLLESHTTLSTGPSAELVIPSAYNTTLRCRLQVKEQERASVEYTIHVTEEQNRIASNQTVLLPVLLGLAAVCVVIAAILILLFRGRRTRDKEDGVLGVELNATHQASQVKEEECEIHYAALEIRQPARERRREMIQEEVIYCLTVKN